MVNLALNNGITALACVPVRASTGLREAVELAMATPSVTAARAC